MPERVNNISPHVYLLATFLTALATLFTYQRIGFENQWFLAPIVGLALFYAAINIYRQSRHSRGFTLLKNIHWPRLIKQAVARYVVWLAIIYSGKVLYQHLPYYGSERFQGNFLFFDQLIAAYLILGKV